jgi:non-ribosomal peptide synthetase component F/thioesterase domain-containing protein
MNLKSMSLPSIIPAPNTPSEEYYAFPLTASQRAMWPSVRGTASDPRFNGAFRMNLAGRVNLDLLQRALREVAQRQECLRTSFRALDAEIQQVVSPTSDLTVDEVDLRSFSDDARAAMLDEISIREATQVFDLAAGAPVRVKLLRMEDARSVLTITVHQIVCDGWSIGLLMEELAANYAAFARQLPPPLPPLGFQYGDFVTWQQENASWAEIQKQLVYWKDKLGGCPRAHISPDLIGTPDLPDAHIVSTLLPRELTESLRALAQSENTTFFVVTMAACMALLARYSGNPDVALRTPLAGRNRVEFEPIIGQFTNHVAVRATAAPEITLRSFIEQLRETVWEALANQDAPFDEVLKAVATADQPASSLFPINFVCQKEYGRNGPSSFIFDGVTMTTLPSKSQGALYDLNFFLVEREVGWRLSLESKAGLYTQKTAESLLQHFVEVLLQIAQEPDRQIGALTLSATEALTKRTMGESAASIPKTLPHESAPTPGVATEEILAMPGSLSQERFYTLSQLDPTNPSFHVPLVMKLAGPLSPALLEASLQRLIDRHESLRTTFRDNAGEFLQIIHPAWHVTLETTVIPGATEAEQSARLAATIEKEIHRPFDLGRLPLFRAVLCTLGNQDHLLIITLHHILADAASAQVIQRELWTTYESLQLGREIELPPLTVQYGDFSVWQRENQDSDAMKAHLDFWLQQLSGDLKVLDFPTDRPPAYRPTSKGAVETLLLPNDLTSSLKRLAQANDTTLYVVTLAIFAALISRASESADVVVGSPVLNRRPETESLIGPFAGPMALRLNLAGDPTLQQLITSARDRTLEALDHADLPFELVLRNLTLRTQNERRPLFQFYFLCQTAFVQSRQAGDLTVTPLPSVSVGTPFEMQLAMIERAEGLRAELEYSAELFDKSTADRWLAYYVQLLAATVADPGQHLADLPQPPFRSRHNPAPAKQLEPGNARAAYVAPRDLVEEMLAQIWEGVLGVPSISVRANFFDIGGTSLMILRMVPRINTAFETVLPVPTIFKAPTIELMANVLRQKSVIEKQVILPLHPNGSRPPLFMVHSYHLYRALPAALGADQPFYGVMELELSDRHAPYTLKDQVATYVQHLREVQPKGPYYLAGFCFFGLLAFEVAAQLEALGETVAFLGLIDTYCPEYWSQRHARNHEASHEPNHDGSSLIPTSTAPLWHHLRKTARLRNFSERVSAHLQFIAAKIRNRWLSLALEIRVGVYTFYVSRGITLPSWLNDPALVTRVGVRRHVPAKIASPVYLFPAEDVPLEPDFDPTLGWGTMTTGKVTTLWIPGDHEDMFKEKNIGALAKNIREAIDQARQRP